MKNWQYLFIIEGSLTIFVALIAWIWLPRGPGSAWFLNADEQLFAAQRIQKDNISYVSHEYGADGVERDRLTKRDVVETAKDWKLFFLLVCNICASVPSQAFSVFMPMVVQGLGYSSIQANLVCRLSCNGISKVDLTMLRVDVSAAVYMWRYWPVYLRPQL